MSVLGANGKRVIWMLQDPVIEEDLDPARKMITNEQIDLYNKGALEVRFLLVSVVQSSVFK